jgi:microcystin-dependent protein
MDNYLGQIMQVGWSFANTGWANCNGALIPISQNQALFALLGTTFGGNGTQTFGLPDVQGRVLIGQGQGAGLSNYVWGQKSGTENTTLTVSNMPAHSHTGTASGLTGTLLVDGTANSGTLNVPAPNSVLASPPNAGQAQVKIYAPAGSSATVPINGVTITGGSVTIGLTGNGLPFPILQPYLAVWTLIATQGIFPTRD